MKIYSLFTLSYTKKKNRINVYDFLRGFAMLLVFLQHSVMPGWEYLLVFHMPLFFFLSGLVSGEKELPSFGVYIKTRFKRLMIVYFVFGLLDVTIYYISGLITHKPYNIVMALLGIVTGQYGFVPDGYSGLYWFLMVMFVADIMIYPINKYFKNNKLALLGGVILFLSLSFVTTHFYPIPVFVIDKSFMASVFLLLGGLCKPLTKYIVDLKIKWEEIIVLILGVLGIWLSNNNNTQLVLMYLNQYGDYFWFLLGSLSGIAAAIILGKYMFILLSKHERMLYRLLLWIGFNSLLLFPVHLEIKQYFSKLYTHFGINHWLLILVTILTISIPLCNFINYYMPWILGQSKKNK